MNTSALFLLLIAVVTPASEAPPSRYGEPPTAAATFDAFTAAPPSAAAAPVAVAWNSQDAASNPLRPQDAAAAAAGAWNGQTDVAIPVPAAVTGPIQRLGAEFQNATAPIREGFDQFGNRIGAAADNLGARTDQLLDELGGQTRSILGRGDVPPAAGAQWNGGVGPGASTAPPDSAAPGTNWNQDAASAAAPAQAGIGWNQPPNEAPPTGVAPGQFPPASQVGPAPPPLINANSPAAGIPPATTPAQSGPAGVTAVDYDRWANSNDPRFRTAAAPSAGTGTDAATPFTGAGPILPPQHGADPGASSAPPAQVGLNPAGAAGPGDVPAVRGSMLNLPSNRQLDDATATASASTAFPAPANTGFPVPPATIPTTPASNASGGLLANNPRPWDTQANPAATSTQPAASDSSARDKAAVILAWVLLFSSVAGNVYLFWSYLDVRTKYRSLVRKTARAVGSRFSAA